MQITETLQEGLKRAYKITLPGNDIRTKVDQELDRLSKKARIDGFRPGKVPMQIIKKRFGESVLGQILEQSIQESCQKLFAEKELRPATDPSIDVPSLDQIKQDSDFEYTVRLEVLPVLPPIDFSNIKLETKKIKLSKQKIKEELDRLAESSAEFSPIELKRPTKKGDTIEIDFVGSVDGKPFAGGTAEGYRVTLGNSGLLEEFEKQLLSKNIGDEFHLHITFPKDYGVAELAGVMAHFDVVIKAALEKKMPDLNDEFAKKQGYENLKDLEKRMQDMLEEGLNETLREDLKKNLFDVLSDQVELDLPETMVTQEFSAIWDQVDQAIKHGTLDEDDRNKTSDQLNQEYQSIAKRRVKLGLVLAEIGRENKIEVSRGDLQLAMLKRARQLRLPVDAVLNFYKTNPQALDSLRGPAFEDKVVDFVLEKINLKETEISYEDFMAEQKSNQTPKESKSKKQDKALKSGSDESDTQQKAKGAKDIDQSSKPVKENESKKAASKSGAANKKAGTKTEVTEKKVTKAKK